MKLRFTLGLKLSIGFGFLALTFLLFSWLTYQRLQRNKEITSRITSVYLVSEAKLNELYVQVGNSKMLLKNWVYIEQLDDTPDKRKLKKLLNDDCPSLMESINEIKKEWSEEDQNSYDQLAEYINDSLFKDHLDIMKKLNSFEVYQDGMTAMMIGYTNFGQGDNTVDTKTLKALQRLDSLIERMAERTKQGTDEMNADFEGFQRLTIILAIVLFFLAIFTAIFSIRMILLPIHKVKNVLQVMSQGILTTDVGTKRNDEVGDMLKALADMKGGLQKTADFAHEIGNGNYTTEFNPLSDKDELGNSLITLRNNLEKAQKESDIREEQDRIQNWSTQGLAKFADILRLHNKDINDLGKNILKNLVKYLDVNQGGIYIFRNENSEQFLELVAMYAYNKEKYRQKKILPGEGLAGLCYLEKKTIHMKELPEDYIHITSGLGKSTPRSILIVPLKMNDEVLGVVELASFEEFKDYQIEFVEQISESIAATVSNVRINNETSVLLDRSNEQAELMRAQEEEMRQNLEELQATQEEFNRSKTEMETELIDARRQIKKLKERLSDKSKMN